MRLAAGLCVLCVALVFGGFGGTVAAADTDSEGSVSDSNGLSGLDHEVDSSSGESTDTTDTTVEPAVFETVPTLLGTFDSGAFLGADHEQSPTDENARGTEEQSSGLTGPMALGVTTGSETNTDAPATVTDDDKGSDTVPADATTQQVNEPEVAVSHSPVTEPSPDPDGPATAPDPPAAEPPAEEPAVQPVTNDVAVVDNSSAQDEAAPLVVGPAAAGNLIAVLAYLFIAAPDGGPPLIALPGDLLSLLGFPLPGAVGGVPAPAGGIGGSLLAGGTYTAARTSPTSSVMVQANWPEMLIASGDSHALSPAGVVHRALEGVSATGVKEEHLSMALADSVAPAQVRSILRHTVGAVLAPLSLLVLALMASPGLAGLTLLAAAGTFVGYRQAKAASILRAVGIGRVVKSGPLGVVRSGSLVAIHSATSRADRRHARQAAISLETVA